MTAYSITDRTELGEVSIITIAQAVSNRVWTLVSDADGHDTLIRPDGTHVDTRAIHNCIVDGDNPVARVIEWITSNV